MPDSTPTIAVFGASGLIGEAIVSVLAQESLPVMPMARRLSSAQRQAFGPTAVETPIASLSAADLSQILAERNVDIVINCIGVLQDGPRGRTDAVHREFVERLVSVLAAQPRPTLLIHLSIPGAADDDLTSFSRSKRAAEHAITSGRVSFVILRPGFVLAPTAYGGSALFRALGILPVGLPERDRTTPFAITDVSDITRTIAVVARRWRNGERRWATVWEVVAQQPSTLGDVVAALSRRLGGPTWRIPIPAWAMDLGAKAGDLVAHLGWAPPVRSTALAEMRRGVSGDPAPWMAATGLTPRTLDRAVQAVPISIQETWFARLYLLKPLILGSLVAFWVLSGLIAVTVAFETATAILTSHGFPPGLARAVTVISSVVDISVGVAIALRKTCRAGLIAGIVVSFGYMTGAAMLTPDLWVEPLGALVKTGPAVVLMLVALATLEER